MITTKRWLANKIVYRWKKTRMECEICEEWSWYHEKKRCAKCRTTTPNVVSEQWKQLELKKQHFDDYLQMLEEQKRGVEMEQMQIRKMHHQRKLREEEEAKEKRERRRVFVLRQKERELAHKELMKLNELHVQDPIELPKVKTPVKKSTVSKATLERLSKARRPAQTQKNEPEGHVQVKAVSIVRKKKKRAKKNIVKKLPTLCTPGKQDLLVWSKTKNVKELDPAIQPKKWYEEMQVELGFFDRRNEDEDVVDVRDLKDRRETYVNQQRQGRDEKQGHEGKANGILSAPNVSSQAFSIVAPRPPDGLAAKSNEPSPQTKYTPEYLQQLLKKYNMPQDDESGRSQSHSQSQSHIESVCSKYA